MIQEVDLSHARLKTLPLVLTQLTKVHTITLRQNLLKEIDLLLELNTVTDLDLYDNEISTIPDLSQLNKLR